jgi:hypothetical protein
VSSPLEANRALWDERAPVHAASPDYGFDRFRDDRTHISDEWRLRESSERMPHS